MPFSLRTCEREDLVFLLSLKLNEINLRNIAFVRIPCCSCKAFIQSDRFWIAPSKASMFLHRDSLRRPVFKVCLYHSVEPSLQLFHYSIENQLLRKSSRTENAIHLVMTVRKINLFRWNLCGRGFLLDVDELLVPTGACFSLQTGQQTGGRDLFLL